MSSKSLEELPIRRLYAIAKSQHLRVGITIDGPIGKSYLDTLDVWDGKPCAYGSRLVARATIKTSVSDAACVIIEQMDDA